MTDAFTITVAPTTAETACTCQQGITPTRFAASTEPFDAPFPVREYPPREWFTTPPDWLTPETKITVDDEGRVAGMFFHHGQCLVHDATACPRPSPTFYDAFHQNEMVTADGESIAVGVIGNVGGHADPRAPISVAIAHYSNPNLQLMAVRAYDNDDGGFILGSMLPTYQGRALTNGDVALVRRSALSGDWRPFPQPWWDAHGITAAAVAECEGFDCIGPTLVTRPGLPIVRPFRVESRVAAVLGGDGGVQLEESPMATGTTTIEVDGVKVTREGLGTSGPHPIQADVDAIQAQPPPGPPKGGPPGAATRSGPPGAAKPDGSPSGSGDQVTRAEFDALVQKVNQLVDAFNAMADSQMAAMEAGALPLPEPQEPPLA
jgi:hypothetical protein